MDEHEAMQMLKSALGIEDDLTPEVEVWDTPGLGPSFGMTIDGASFVVTVTELP